MTGDGLAKPLRSLPPAIAVSGPKTRLRQPAALNQTALGEVDRFRVAVGHAGMIQQHIEQDHAMRRLVQGGDAGDPENVTGRQHQAKAASQSEHPRAESDGQRALGLLGIGDARPRHGLSPRRSGAHRCRRARAGSGFALS